MNFKGAPRFTAYSAGSHATGMVRPEALRQLEIAHMPTQGLRSKSWEEFSNAPKLDFVFTVCDQGSLSHLAGTAHDGALGRARSARAGRRP